MHSIPYFLMLVVFGLFGPVQNVAAENPEWRSNTQFLPQYCKDRVDPTRWKKWRKTFGQAYIHMHHYCAGLYAEKKVRAISDRRQREYWLQRVVGQMAYVSRACQPGCVLYPELHSMWGWGLWQQGQIGEATKHYMLAIKNKQTYTRAYADLADMYVKINESDEAKKVLEAGLKANPKSRRLKRRLRKLDPAA